MSTIRIHQPGLLTTIQDLGRFGYQQYGMPIAGAMDTHSMRLANYLVGNSSGEACLEATLLGPEIEFLADSCIGICGGVAPTTINPNPVELNRTLFVKKGEVLRFDMMRSGCRLYIAFAGGIKVPKVMGSKSTYLRGKIGGFNGRKLESGDEIEVGGKTVHEIRTIPSECLLPLQSIQNIRIISGPEINRFTFEGIQAFLNSEYSISPQSDRMGYRLSGSKITHNNRADILSSGLANGAIQVPSHGEPIIMLADHQTVGGYTRIANVITVDLPILGQMKAGDKIRFKEVKLDEGHDLLGRYQQMLKGLKNN